MSTCARACLVTMSLILSGCATVFRAEPQAHPSSPDSWHHIPEIPQAPHLVRIRNDRYRVASPWTVELRDKRWQVENGYICNGITAPQHVRRFLGDGVEAPETWAAVFHDWLFTQPGITRSQADKLFYELLLAYGVSPIKARVMHTTVASYSVSKIHH